MQTVLHVSPHPDDESIGVPCTLLALKAAGWRVVNMTCSLGRPADHLRRREELQAALTVGGFENRLPDASVALSGGDSAYDAMHRLVPLIAEQVRETGATLVVGPHPRDSHHGHATVARAIRQVVREQRGDLVWWMWSIWADLPRPTLVVDCRGYLDASEEMLGKYVGENGRNDYLAMHRAIRQVNAVRGTEKVFGFGSSPRSSGTDVEYAELLTEVTLRGRTWMVGRPRLLDAAHPLVDAWVPLDDLSLLSSTRFRPLYRPALMASTELLHRLRRKKISY